MLAVPVFGQTPDQRAPIKTSTPTPGLPRSVAFKWERRMDNYQRFRAAAEYVMTLSDADMLALVPEQAGLANAACPNCNGGRPNNANWLWKPQDPHRIECRDCGEVYPNNPKYPDDEYIAVDAPGGEHRYHYYHPEGRVRLYFRAKADYYCREYLSDACAGLAVMYWETKDEQYARRAAMILLRFAEVYPGYAYHFQYPGRETLFSPYSKPSIPGITEPYRTTRWTGWAYEDISGELTQAYDIIRFWPGLDAMAGGEARQRIEQDLLVAMCEWVLGIEETYTNMSPVMWRDALYAGRVLDRPEWILDIFTRMRTFTDTSFLYDGAWMETSLSYAAQTYYGLRHTLDELAGYTPPDDAPSQIKAALRDNLAAVIAACNAGQRIQIDLAMPHGAHPTINDTWSKATGVGRDRMQSALAPGMGMAVLGGGTGEHQLYAWLNFTGGRYHKHQDALSIGLYAFGEELLRDIGYTHSIGRAWASSSMSHNTVIVDGVESTRDNDFKLHHLRAFATDGRAFHLAEAESLAAYPQTSRFRRTLVQVGADDRDAYLIDVFQVIGGKQHDYLLHGVADADSTMTIDGVSFHDGQATLLNADAHFVYPQWESPREGDFGEGGGAAYGYVHSLSSGPANDPVIIDLRRDDQPAIGVRTHLFHGERGTAYLGKAPSVRRAEGNGDRFHDYQAPLFAVRRSGKELRSAFVAVHDLVNGEPKVAAVTVDRTADRLIVRVDLQNGTTDYFIMGLDGSVAVEHPTMDGMLQFDGRYGLIRTRDGHVQSGHTLGATTMALGDWTAKGVAGWQGVVEAFARRADGASRGWFDIPDRLPGGLDLGVLRITFPDDSVRAFNVSWYEPKPKGTRVYVNEDPGYVLTDDGIHFATYPQHDIAGQTVRYECMYLRSIYE